ncbi:TMEM175 family protein [Novosphingobium profundi]|uniref:TMEM175 family protein n=1 Tax=Novosphingobium profundi TaxID=1774954 RepID=UPI001CFD8092|nr:TMEM175 family protein [Novosphingobium profundi]
MNARRLESLTDGVIAIVITIMVLELHVPGGGSLTDLAQALPLLVAYSLSFINVGLYWNNHHHLFQLAPRIDGKVLWANHFLLFWLSLVPFVIRWLDASSYSVGATAAYGIVLGGAAIGFFLLERAIIACNGVQSILAQAIGMDAKGWGTLAIYAIAVPLSFVSRWIALSLYILVIALWLVPDRRLARSIQG